MPLPPSLESLSTVMAFCSMNHRSAIENAAFMYESEPELLTTGCVLEVPDRPHICSLLSVVESGSGKKFLV